MKIKKIIDFDNLNDNEFCDALGVLDTLSREVCCVIRKLLASEFGFPKEKLHPEITTKQIFQNSWRAVVGEEIFGALERELSKHHNITIMIDDKQVLPFLNTCFFGFGRRRGATTIGEWIIALTEYLVKQIQEVKHPTNQV